jgi:hypothetical protein
MSGLITLIIVLALLAVFVAVVPMGDDDFGDMP